MPADSATLRAVGGPPDPWGLAEQLLAVIADALHGANWQRENQGRPKSEWSVYPKRLLRPGVDDAAAKAARRNSAEIKQRLERLRQRDAKRRAKGVNA